MKRQDILNRYLFWLTGLVCDEYRQRYYQRLLELLHEIEFTWIVENDMNRAADGIDLRGRFAEEEGLDFLMCRRVLDGPCSVLEMMVGLACRCEDSIMGDIEYGDRTPKWFWIMIHNMGLNEMDDGRINEDVVRDAVNRVLNREYRKDGRGGLFYVPECRKNLRRVEIWYQMCFYLNTIIDDE